MRQNKQAPNNANGCGPRPRLPLQTLPLTLGLWEEGAKASAVPERCKEGVHSSPAPKSRVR
eukprot:3721671-Alexandrium_andersonii.AAC.1